MSLKPSTVQMKRSNFLRGRRTEAKAIIKFGKRMKSNGMKGRTPTADEQRFMDAMGALPCVACLKDGRENHHVSLHHVAGRTAPDAHKKVIPLCSGHHQDGTGEDKSLIAVHPYRARFESMYGTQMELLAEAKLMLGME